MYRDSTILWNNSKSGALVPTILSSTLQFSQKLCGSQEYAANRYVHVWLVSHFSFPGYSYKTSVRSVFDLQTWCSIAQGHSWSIECLQNTKWMGVLVVSPHSPAPHYVKLHCFIPQAWIVQHCPDSDGPMAL